MITSWLASGTRWRGGESPGCLEGSRFPCCTHCTAAHERGLFRDSDRRGLTSACRQTPAGKSCTRSSVLRASRRIGQSSVRTYAARPLSISVDTSLGSLPASAVGTRAAALRCSETTRDVSQLTAFGTPHCARTACETPHFASLDSQRDFVAATRAGTQPSPPLSAPSSCAPGTRRPTAAHLDRLGTFQSQSCTLSTGDRARHLSCDSDQRRHFAWMETRTGRCRTRHSVPRASIPTPPRSTHTWRDVQPSSRAFSSSYASAGIRPGALDLPRATPSRVLTFATGSRLCCFDSTPVLWPAVRRPSLPVYGRRTHADIAYESPDLCAAHTECTSWA